MNKRSQESRAKLKNDFDEEWRRKTVEAVLIAKKEKRLWIKDKDASKVMDSCEDNDERRRQR